MKSDFGFDVDRPTVSLVLTIHNRPPEVSKAVADSFRFKGNQPDEAVIILDRPTDEARDGALVAWADADFPVRFCELDGEPGWKCPARAWNAAYETATCDLLYQTSSEVVQDAGNIEKARELAKDGNVAVFGACHNSKPTQLVVGAEPGLLASAAMPRPLGFIVCLPKGNILAIDGNDLAFMDGLWYEDDDLFVRLWRSGLDFLFSDAIHGTHLDHERPVLNTIEGQRLIEHNASLMLKKHGSIHPWTDIPKLVTYGAAQTRWSHL